MYSKKSVIALYSIIFIVLLFAGAIAADALNIKKGAGNPAVVSFAQKIRTFTNQVKIGLNNRMVKDLSDVAVSGTTASQIKLAPTTEGGGDGYIVWSIDGVLYEKDATDPVWSFEHCEVTTTSGSTTSNIFLLGLDSSGTGKVSSGTSNTTTANIVYPELNASYTWVGAIQLSCTTKAFTGGIDTGGANDNQNLFDEHCTETIVDLAGFHEKQFPADLTLFDLPEATFETGITGE